MIRGVDWTWTPQRLLRRSVVVLAACIAALLAFDPSAHALLQRGHTFGSSFGEGVGLSGPSAVAVNEASGDVYALDTENNRVVRFGPAPEHAFIEAWGFGVSDGVKAFERCTSACRPGLAGFAKGEFDHPVGIAVDNSSGSPSQGDVYVIANRTATKAVIDKFSPEGQLVGRLIAKKEEKEAVEGIIAGVAVGPDGSVWVERESEGEEFVLEHFNNQAPTNHLLGTPRPLEIPLLEGPRPVRPGFAVDSEDNLYVTYEPGGEDLEEIEEEEEAINRVEKARKRKHEPPAGLRAEGPCERNTCHVAKLAIVQQPGFAPEALPLSFEIDGENSTGVAVDLSSGAQASGDVYLDNVTSANAFTSSLGLIQRFGSEQLQRGTGLAVDAASDEVFVADAAAGRIDAYIPSPPGPPVVESGTVLAAQVSADGAELRATIDPSGVATHYRFQYGPVSCAASPASCTEAPASPGGELPAVFGDQHVSVPVSGLTESTKYYFRVIAENALGQVLSEERTFKTTSSALGSALPDGRAWELVSPPSKHGASVEPIEREGGLIQSSADGKSVTYMTSAPVGENEPEGSRGPERSQIFSSRGANAWSSLDIATPNGRARGIRNGLAREYEIFSNDLQEALLDPASELPLSEQTSEKTIYLRHNPLCTSAPASCFEPLVTAANDGAESQFGYQLTVKGATPDLRHVVFSSGVPLIKGTTINNALYEWTAGQLQLLSVLPNGEPTVEASFLGGFGSPEMSSTAISEDGSRVVWLSNSASDTGHLYEREVAKAQTVQIDEPNSGVPAPKISPKPDFKMASADGSRVFFSDAQRLTQNSTAPEGTSLTPPQDLYVFEPEKPAGERLTDLTVPNSQGEAAGIQGEAIDSSDGSFVYFVANGVLAEGAQPGNCRPEAPGACNLYVAHYNGTSWETRLIARLSAEDAPDWGRSGPEPGSNYELKVMTSRVSPNGQFLAFMSDRPLTGYNNIDEKTGVRDEEVFLYSYGAGRVVCASCNPTGAQPLGVFDTQESGEGLGLVVDRNESWGDTETGVAHTLAASIPAWTNIALFESFYQSRYLSNQGRLFFNSPDALVTRAKNRGKMDVYEYEPKGVGSCSEENTEAGCVALISSGESEHESAFVDASESGNDVFFVTAAKLSPRDADTTYDIYDARVCQAPGSEACVNEGSIPPPPCSSEACKPPATPQPSFGTPPSARTQSSGNVPRVAVLPQKISQKPKTTTLAEKRAAALRACAKKYKSNKKKRALCEKQARKKYAAKKAQHAHKSQAKRG